MSDRQLPAQSPSFDVRPFYRTFLWLFMAALASMLLFSVTLLALGSGHYLQATFFGTLFLYYLWATGGMYIALPLNVLCNYQYRVKHDYLGVDRSHRRALKILNLLPVRRGSAATVLESNLALMRLCEGDYESAASLFAQAAARVANSRRKSETITGIVIYNNLAVAYFRLGRLVEAETAAAKAIEIAEAPKMRKRAGAMLAVGEQSMGMVRLRFGEPQESIEHFQKALRIYDTAPTPAGMQKESFDHARAYCLCGLAIAHMNMGDVAESTRWCDQMLQALHARPQLLNPMALERFNALANDYMNNNLFDRAEKLLDLAYYTGREQPFHPDAKQTLNFYEKLLLLTNRQAEVADMRSWLRHIELQRKAIEKS